MNLLIVVSVLAFTIVAAAAFYLVGRAIEARQRRARFFGTDIERPIPPDQEMHLRWN